MYNKRRSLRADQRTRNTFSLHLTSQFLLQFHLLSTSEQFLKIPEI
jgi:hypothetical protein